MTRTILAAAASVFLLSGSLRAHRLDEYLQATLVSVRKDGIEASMRLIPGVAVSRAVLAGIDTNGDGVLSANEQQAYTARVLADLSLSGDGQPLKPRLIAAHFPDVAAMKEGIGEIQIEFAADFPHTRDKHRFVLENHHRNTISVYLMNCLVPDDRDLGIVSQTRNVNQSLYQVDYVQAHARVPAVAPHSVGFASIFRLGIHHIADGTDHLLFLLALLLPAPLIAANHRWGRSAGVRRSLLNIASVVTAFTMGHSLTLAAAAWGWIHVPSRPVEVLIAVSILISAVHALRPLFPGRESWIAAFFGLIHGLAFATTITELGLARWERVVSILAFNLGIETMQLVVVAAVMPSLMLLSRTGAYSVLRIGGALFAAFAAAGWIAERLLGLSTSADVLVNAVAHHSVWIAGELFAFSALCWLLQHTRRAHRLAALQPLREHL